MTLQNRADRLFETAVAFVSWDNPQVIVIEQAKNVACHMVDEIKNFLSSDENYDGFPFESLKEYIRSIN